MIACTVSLLGSYAMIEGYPRSIVGSMMFMLPLRFDLLDLPPVFGVDEVAWLADGAAFCTFNCLVCMRYVLR